MKKSIDDFLNLSRHIEVTYRKSGPTLSKHIFDKRKFSRFDRIINFHIKNLERYMNKLGKKKELWDEEFINFLEIKDK